MRRPQRLSRASSSASNSSTDTSISGSRRTRRRFTNSQVILLERLFHQVSHPSREEREALAKEGSMEVKSVTIWFQNRRQTNRRTALHNATNYSNNTRTHSHSRGAVDPPAGQRLTLDQIATLTELPTHSSPNPPQTPRARRSALNPWDNMLSSPVEASGSPTMVRSREYVKFGRGRTLEWACANALIYGIEEGEAGVEGPGDETEDESEEAITPRSSLGGSDTCWNGAFHNRIPLASEGKGVEDVTMKNAETIDVVHDDDMMKAALALCGLGRG